MQLYKTAQQTEDARAIQHAGCSAVRDKRSTLLVLHHQPATAARRLVLSVGLGDCSHVNRSNFFTSTPPTGRRRPKPGRRAL